MLPKFQDTLVCVSKELFKIHIKQTGTIYRKDAQSDRVLWSDSAQDSEHLSHLPSTSEVRIDAALHVDQQVSAPR